MYNNEKEVCTDKVSRAFFILKEKIRLEIFHNNLNEMLS